jgi:hypothetical protein
VRSHDRFDNNQNVKVTFNLANAQLFDPTTEATLR